MTMFTLLLRSMPLRAITATKTTTPTANGNEAPMPVPCAMYPAKPSAAVAAEADLAQRNIQPAVKPSEWFSQRWPYS